MIPAWAYLVAAVIYALIWVRRRRLLRQAQIPNVIEGRHRPLPGSRGF
jgi:hypothetical protein